MPIKCCVGLSQWIISKESTCNTEDAGGMYESPCFRKIPWSRKWQPTPIFLHENSHGQSLEGYCPYGCKELDMTEWLSTILCTSQVLQGEGDGTPLQNSCLENPMDGGAWWAAVHGVTKSQTRLSNFTFTFHFHALEKEMATHSSVLAWRIPGTGEPGGLPSMGSHRVGHDWSDLAASTSLTLPYPIPSLTINSLGTLNKPDLVLQKQIKRIAERSHRIKCI